MKNTILIILVFGVVQLFSNCSEDNSLTPGTEQNNLVSYSLKSTAKPSPNLIGEINTAFTLTPPAFWNGTVGFGTGDIYAITFISYTPPRDYSQASPFYEDFIIYELGNSANVYLKGYNVGVVTLANKAPEPTKVIANGKIVEAYEPFEMWLGRHVHWDGLVYWVSIGLPASFSGTIRLN